MGWPSFPVISHVNHVTFAKSALGSVESGKVRCRGISFSQMVSITACRFSSHEETIGEDVADEEGRSSTHSTSIPDQGPATAW